MFERFKQGFARRPIKRDQKTSDQRYHAVSFILPAKACDAAKALIGQRFLAAEAPIFPIDGCDAASCSCGYRHYGDRRDGPRRRALEIGISEEFRTDGERRDSSERRNKGPRNDEKPAGKAVDYYIYLNTR